MGEKKYQRLHVDCGISCHSLIFPPKVQAAFKVDLELRAAIITVKCNLNSSSERELHLLRKGSCWEIKLVFLERSSERKLHVCKKPGEGGSEQRKWPSEAGIHCLGRCLLIIFRINIIAPFPADGFGKGMWLRKCEFSFEVRACPCSMGELLKQSSHLSRTWKIAPL